MTGDRRHREDIEITVRGKKLQVPAQMQAKVDSKVRKLGKYLDQVTAVDVELSREKSRDADLQNRVEMTAHARGQGIRVVAFHREALSAVDEAVEHLYRQLNRQKEKVKGHHHDRPLTEPLVAEETADGAQVEDRPDGRLEVLRQQVILEPQFEEEAIDDLAESGQIFRLFLNARTEQVNLVYRRADGSYCVVQPAFR